MKETKYTVKYTTSFKKDYKRAIKRGLKIELLEQVIARSQYGSTNFSGCQLIHLIGDRQCIGSEVDRSIRNAHQLANSLFYVIGASRTMHVQYGKRLFL